MKIHFKPTLWGTFALLVFCSLFIALGLWQLDRGRQKHEIYQQYLQRSELPAIDLNHTLTHSTDMNGRKAIAKGHYLTSSPQVLLDNQIYKGRVGYSVLTPFKLDDNHLIIWVHRGWIPMPAGDRSKLPDITEELTHTSLEGILISAPTTGITLEETPIESLTPQILRIQTFDLVQLTQKTGLVTLPSMLKLVGGTQGPFVQEWQSPGSGEQKHYGYAFQWFSFAILAIIIYLVTAIRRPKQDASVKT